MKVIYDRKKALEYAAAQELRIKNLIRIRDLGRWLNVCTLLIIIGESIYLAVTNQALSLTAFLTNVIVICLCLISTVLGGQSVPKKPTFVTPAIWYWFATTECEAVSISKIETETGYAIHLSFDVPEGEHVKLVLGEVRDIRVSSDVSEETLDLENMIMFLPAHHKSEPEKKNLHKEK